jgi:hypothetical protein
MPLVAAAAMGLCLQLLMKCPCCSFTPGRRFLGLSYFCHLVAGVGLVVLAIWDTADYDETHYYG